MTPMLSPRVLAGLLLAASCAQTPLLAQMPPRVEIMPQRDSAITPAGRVGLTFGFRKQVVDSAGLPVAVPARSYCVHAKRDGDFVLVDSIASRAEFELPACPAELVPLVIRPVCELSFAEHVVWVVQKVRPVILFCDMPPKVFLLSKPGAP